MFSTKINLLYLLYSTGRKCCLLPLIKQNCFLKPSNLDGILILMTQISLPVFSSRTNQKLHNISVIPKLVKTIVTDLHLPKASGPDYVTVVVIKNSEPELSYILPELFNVCLEETCFPDCWKVSLVFPVFKMLGERCTA